MFVCFEFRTRPINSLALKAAKNKFQFRTMTCNALCAIVCKNVFTILRRHHTKNQHFCLQRLHSPCVWPLVTDRSRDHLPWRQRILFPANWKLIIITHPKVNTKSINSVIQICARSSRYASVAMWYSIYCHKSHWRPFFLILFFVWEFLPESTRFDMTDDDKPTFHQPNFSKVD